MFHSLDIETFVFLWNLQISKSVTPSWALLVKLLFCLFSRELLLLGCYYTVFIRVLLYCINNLLIGCYYVVINTLLLIICEWNATYGLLLKPGPGPCIRTLKNLDPNPGPGPWKTWSLKNMDPEKHGSWKTWNKYGMKKYVWL